MDKIILNAEKRDIKGRKVKRIRSEGILPANIYGKKVKSTSIKIKARDFEEIFKKAGETSLVEINLDKEKRPVLIHNVQMSPITDKPIHIDFLQVDLKEKVTAEVPVELIGESPAEKQGVGTVVQYINEIEVEALPMDLPEKFELDTSILKDINNAIFVKDLKVKDKDKVDIKNDPEGIIAKVEEIKEEVEEVPVPTEVPAEGVPSETPEGEKVETPQGGEFPQEATKEEVKKE